MHVLSSVQATDTSMTLLLACLHSEASASPAISSGKERDQESGLDYFGARYFGSSMGRWMSPDPSGLFYADQTNPQSLNLYSYVLNNPLKFIDPDGLDECQDSGGNVIPDNQGGDNDTNCAKAGGTWIVKQDPTNTADVKPPAQGTDLVYDMQVAQSEQYLQTHKVEGIDPNYGFKVFLSVAQQTKSAKCLQQALGKNGVSLGLDIAGSIPGEGTAASIAQYGVSLASAVNSAKTNDTTGGLLAAGGMTTSLVSALASATGAQHGVLKAVPFVGTIFNILGAKHDLSGVAKDYQECMNQP